MAEKYVMTDRPPVALNADVRLHTCTVNAINGATGSFFVHRSTWDSVCRLHRHYGRGQVLRGDTDLATGWGQASCKTDYAALTKDPYTTAWLQILNKYFRGESAVESRDSGEDDIEQQEEHRVSFWHSSSTIDVTVHN